jgi:hypothetical protein
MATLFWGGKGMLMMEFMQKWTTITSEVYGKHQKNTAACTQSLLEHLNWGLFDHPPYSSHLTPSDYHLFTYLKNWLRSQRFNNKEELM